MVGITRGLFVVYVWFIVGSAIGLCACASADPRENAGSIAQAWAP